MKEVQVVNEEVVNQTTSFDGQRTYTYSEELIGVTYEFDEDRMDVEEDDHENVGIPSLIIVKASDESNQVGFY